MKNFFQYIAVQVVLIGSLLSFIAYAGNMNNPSGGATGTAAITGGTIDNTAIGNTTSAAGTFTTNTAASYNVTGSTLPANGLYLPATNTLGLSANSLKGIEIDGAASVVNAFAFKPSTTGNAIAVTATGSDANITLQLNGKGTGGAALLGTSTADSATAGYVGERITAGSSGGTPFPTSTQYGDCVSIVLTPGNWSVNYQLLASFSVAGQFAALVTSTSGNSNAGGVFGDNDLVQQAPANVSSATTISDYRVALAATTTYYGKVWGSYTGTATYYCRLSAERTR